MDSDDDPFNDDNGYYSDPISYLKNGMANIPEPEFLHGDYGFQMRMDEDMEVFIPKPFFNLESYGIKEKIKKVTISEEIFMILSENHKIFRWEIETNRVTEITIPGIGADATAAFARDFTGMMKDNLMVEKKNPSLVERIFLDSKGTHCVLCTTRGENYYIHKKMGKAKLLKNFKERVRSAIFDDHSSNDLVKIVFGTHDGKICPLNIELNKAMEINDIPFRLIINNLSSPVLHMEYFHYFYNDPAIGKESLFKAIFVLTGQYLYFFTGNQDLATIFERFAGKDPSTFKGLPIMSPKKSPLINFFTVRNKTGIVLGNSFVMSDGNYIHYCKFPERIEKSDFSPFSQMQTLKYARKESQKSSNELKIAELPLSIACSVYHYYILHRDCITILSTINESIVAYYEGKDLSDNMKVNGLIVERGGENIYVYDATSIRSISMNREGQDVWKIYLENEKYLEAYNICKKNRFPSLNYVTGLYADHLFKIGKYEMAADKYAETSRSFEEICLKYVMKDAIIYLERYLKFWLNHPSVMRDQMRRTILLSWLLEHKLHWLNEKEREVELMDAPEADKKNELSKARQLFHEFLVWHQDQLDEQVTYSTLQSHGRFKEFVEFAENKGKFEDIILHHINEEEYDLALEKMEKLQREDLKQEMMYKHCHVLMKELPDETFQFLKNHMSEYELQKLIPGFMNVLDYRRHYVVTFLRPYCVGNDICKDKAIHNIYISFLADIREEKLIDEYLTKQEELLLSEEGASILYDLDFALSNFQKHKLVRPQIKVFGMIGLFTDAVNLALEANLIEEAKELASKPEGTTPEAEDLRKRLWMKIAMHLIKTKQIDGVMKLTRDSGDILRIEDLLPQFDDDFQVELFKDNISASLKGYVENIKKLKTDMHAFDKNLEQLKGELRGMKNRYLEINGDQNCEECSRSIFVEDFYGFSCCHYFHAECLKKKLRVINIRPEELVEVEEQERRLERLEDDLKMIQGTSKKPAVAFLENYSMTGGQGRNSLLENRGAGAQASDLEKQIKKVKKRIDFLLARECLACGKYLIDSIMVSLDHDEKAGKAWEL